MTILFGFLSGYCFSASLPPMLAAGALKALDLMEDKPSMFTDIQERSEALHEAFEHIEGLELFGDKISPVKHLRVKRQSPDRKVDKGILGHIVVRVSE